MSRHCAGALVGTAEARREAASSTRSASTLIGSRLRRCVTATETWWASRGAEGTLSREGGHAGETVEGTAVESGVVSRDGALWGGRWRGVCRVIMKYWRHDLNI